MDSSTTLHMLTFSLNTHINKIVLVIEVVHSLFTIKWVMLTGRNMISMQFGLDKHCKDNM